MTIRGYQFLVGLFVAASAAFAQSTTGTISGTVVGDNGSPIAGARVFAGLKQTSQAVKSPPTLVSKVSTTVLADAKGAFSISNLPGGLYVLCAQTATSGWLDPCHWAAAPPVVALSTGSTVSGQKIVLTKGAVVQVQINDPTKLLSTSLAAVTHDVEVLALTSNKAYYYAHVTSTNAVGRTYELTVPFALQHTLIVRSQQFALQDSKGAAVSAAGFTAPVQVASSAVAAAQFAFTITGKN
jgi:hypothetical protein